VPHDDRWNLLLTRLEAVMGRLEALFSPVEVSVETTEEPGVLAWRWNRQASRGQLQPIHLLPTLQLEDLLGIDEQKHALVENTRRFVAGLPANNVLLTGARGTGKSSLIKALLPRFGAQGLRLVEVDRDALADLPEILESLTSLSGSFIIFCDDLSFEAGEAHYRMLKSVLDGSMLSPTGHVLIYATSNRRHLVPEMMADNQGTRHEAGEVHPADAVEETLALSDRFGLWLSFYTIDQDQYLQMARHWVEALGGAVADESAFHQEAIRWALRRGARSGRIALHFARDWVGR
jgi:hypothetical protein